MTNAKEFYLLNNDVIFKNVFNTKERLKRLLESILKVEIYDIKERLLKFLSSKNKEELEANSEGDKFMEEIKEEVERLNVSEKTLDELYVEGEERRVRNTERKIGREEGIEQGIKQEKIEIAKNMLAENIETEMISKITGLSLAEIEALKK